MYRVRETSLLCHVCRELPQGDIFQCKNGHSMCASCSSELQVCPQCRVQFGGEEERIRNLALEELIGETEVPCIHMEHGCPAEIARKELPAHVSSCPFRPMGICKLLGHNGCDFVSRNPDELFEHVVIAHRQNNKRPKNSETTYSFRIGELLKVVKGTKAIQMEVFCIGIDVSPPNCKILEVYAWNREKDNFSVFPVHFAQEEEEEGGCPYEVTIKLTAPAKNVCLSWTQQPVHYKKLEECLNNPPINIPIRFLLANFEVSEARMHWDFTLKN